jgi:hypothetical protein
MAKHIKHWIEVRATGGLIHIEGSESERNKGQPGNSECWLSLTQSEASWLLGQLAHAMYANKGVKGA